MRLVHVCVRVCVCVCVCEISSDTSVGRGEGGGGGCVRSMQVILYMEMVISITRMHECQCLGCLSTSNLCSLSTGTSYLLWMRY